MKIQAKHFAFELNEETLEFQVQTQGKIWRSEPSFVPSVQLADAEVKFPEAKEIVHTPYTNGIGEGILSEYQFDSFAFRTNIWIETATENLYFEWIPLKEELNQIKRVNW